MPQRKLWDSEIWDDIYHIEDRATRIVTILLYRMVLDIHNSDKIANAVTEQLKSQFARKTKLAAIGISALLALDAILNTIHQFT